REPGFTAGGNMIPEVAAVVEAARAFTRTAPFTAESRDLFKAVEALEARTEQYATELRTELAKFAKGEEPYPYGDLR
ncbi:MAG TPA: hypothetical protein VFG99_09525, partial [Chloroflexia bacterium]|nr:hypothetical protein [Chloroflexia bacterium]